MWMPADYPIWLPPPVAFTLPRSPQWSDGPDAYALVIELSPFRKRDVTVEVKERTIEIRAERERGVWSKERRSVHHSLTLPEGADPNTVRADFRDGCLEIRVDKLPVARRRTIPIRVERELPAPQEKPSSARRFIERLKGAIDWVAAGFAHP